MSSDSVQQQQQSSEHEDAPVSEHLGPDNNEEATGQGSATEQFLFANIENAIAPNEFETTCVALEEEIERGFRAAGDSVDAAVARFVEAMMIEVPVLELHRNKVVAVKDRVFSGVVRSSLYASQASMTRTSIDFLERVFSSNTHRVVELKKKMTDNVNRLRDSTITYRSQLEVFYLDQQRQFEQLVVPRATAALEAKNAALTDRIRVLELELRAAKLLNQSLEYKLERGKYGSEPGDFAYEEAYLSRPRTPESVMSPIPSRPATAPSEMLMEDYSFAEESAASSALELVLVNEEVEEEAVVDSYGSAAQQEQSEEATLLEGNAAQSVIFPDAGDVPIDPAGDASRSLIDPGAAEDSIVVESSAEPLVEQQPEPVEPDQQMQHERESEIAVPVESRLTVANEGLPSSLVSEAPSLLSNVIVSPPDSSIMDRGDSIESRPILVESPSMTIEEFVPKVSPPEVRPAVLNTPSPSALAVDVEPSHSAKIAESKSAESVPPGEGVRFERSLSVITTTTLDDEVDNSSMQAPPTKIVPSAAISKELSTFEFDDKASVASSINSTKGKSEQVPQAMPLTAAASAPAPTASPNVVVDRTPAVAAKPEVAATSTSPPVIEVPPATVPAIDDTSSQSAATTPKPQTARASDASEGSQRPSKTSEKKIRFSTQTPAVAAPVVAPAPAPPPKVTKSTAMQTDDGFMRDEIKAVENRYMLRIKELNVNHDLELRKQMNSHDALKAKYDFLVMLSAERQAPKFGALVENRRLTQRLPARPATVSADSSLESLGTPNHQRRASRAAGSPGRRSTMVMNAERDAVVKGYEEKIILLKRQLEEESRAHQDLRNELILKKDDVGCLILQLQSLNELHESYKVLSKLKLKERSVLLRELMNKMNAMRNEMQRSEKKERRAATAASSVRPRSTPQHPVAPTSIELPGVNLVYDDSCIKDPARADVRSSFWAGVASVPNLPSASVPISYKIGQGKLGPFTPAANHRAQSRGAVGSGVRTGNVTSTLRDLCGIQEDGRDLYAASGGAFGNVDRKPLEEPDAEDPDFTPDGKEQIRHIREQIAGMLLERERAEKRHRVLISRRPHSPNRSESPTGAVRGSGSHEASTNRILPAVSLLQK